MSLNLCYFSLFFTYGIYVATPVFFHSHIWILKSWLVHKHIYYSKLTYSTVRNLKKGNLEFDWNLHAVHKSKMLPKYLKKGPADFKVLVCRFKWRNFYGYQFWWIIKDAYFAGNIYIYIYNIYIYIIYINIYVYIYIYIW